MRLLFGYVSFFIVNVNQNLIITPDIKSADRREMLKIKRALGEIYIFQLAFPNSGAFSIFTLNSILIKYIPTQNTDIEQAETHFAAY